MRDGEIGSGRDDRRAFTVIVIVDEVAGLPETQDSAEVSTT
jgi:hypothetical protein